jgi:voltage-gated potassium channel
MTRADDAPLRRRVWLALESQSQSDRSARLVSLGLIGLIIANVAAVVLDSVAEVRAEFGAALDFFEAVCIGIFTLEYLARLWASAEAGARWKYVLSPLAIIDLLAILPFFIGALAGVDLRTLRALRLLRLLKLSRYFSSFQVLGDVLRAEARGLTAGMFVMVVLVVVAASLMHFAERAVQPEAFGDIPRAMWWAAVTLTTVGYGDVAPVTALGQFIAVVIMALGVGMVALPAGMLASRFSEELDARRYDFSNAVRRSGHSGEALEELRQRLCLSEKDAERLTTGFGNGVLCPVCHQLVSPAGIGG